MNIMLFNYIYPAGVLLLLFIVYILIYEYKYSKWVKKHWFFNRRLSSKFSTLIYVLALSLFVFAALDIRGDAKKINASIPDQKTIIMIDVSSSMLAEDVKPNRFLKSIMMARLFIKRAVGHKISIVIFSETSKVVVPFTNDIDLLDARLKALSTLDVVAGSTDLSLSIREVISYFSANSIGVGANILLFTDVENQEVQMPIELPPSINFGVIGVGTRDGGRIPMRDKQGILKRYKKFMGKEIVTKLEEGNIEKLFSKESNYKYWIVNSYKLATEEVYSFFRSSFKAKLSESEIYIREVYSYYFILGGIILYIISIMFRFVKPFKIPLAAILLCVGVAHSVEQNEAEHLLKLLNTNSITKSERNRLAELWLRSKKEKDALTLYKESQSRLIFDEVDEVVFNRGTAYLATSNLKDGVRELITLQNRVRAGSATEAFLDKSRANLLLAVAKKQRKKKSGKSKSGKKKKKSKNNKKKEGASEKKGEKKKGNSKDNKQKKEETKQQKEKENSKDEEKKKENEKKKQEKRDVGKSLEMKEQAIKKRRKLVKTPAVLKSLMDSDRNIQRVYMNTLINSKQRTLTKRDW